jgi:hypothetical protein
MDFLNRTDDYLKKTYCHLLKNVLPQNSQNMQNYPPEEMWQGVHDEITKAIQTVSNELSKRQVNTETISCDEFNCTSCEKNS